MAPLEPAPAPPRPADGDATAAPAPARRAAHHRRRAASRAPLAAALSSLAALGAWGLGRRGMWVDEAISVGATGELVATWRGTGGTMAAYYALLTPWSWLGDSRAWLRSLSLLFALAAVVAVWAVARRAFDHRVAGAAAALTATSWLVVRYAQEARAYSLVLLLTAASWLALVAAIDADAEGDDARRTRWWRAFAALAIVAPLAHGLAVLQLAGQLTFLAASPQRARWLHRSKPVVIGVVAVTAMLMAVGAAEIASWIPPMSLAQVGDLVGALTAPHPLAAATVLAAGALGVHALVARRRAALERGDERAAWFALLPLAWGLVPVLLLVGMSIARPYLLARYVVGVAPGLALVLAFAVLGPDGRLRLPRAAAVAIPVALALAWGQLDLHRDPGDDWRGAAATVAADAQPGDALVLPNPSVRSAFDRGWSELGALPDDAAGLRPFSPVDPVGDVRRFYLVRSPATLAADLAAAPEQRAWVVDQEGIGFDDALSPFLADPAVEAAFVEVARTELDGGLTVVLLERR